MYSHLLVVLKMNSWITIGKLSQVDKFLEIVENPIQALLKLIMPSQMLPEWTGLIVIALIMLLLLIVVANKFFKGVFATVMLYYIVSFLLN